MYQSNVFVLQGAGAGRGEVAVLRGGPVGGARQRRRVGALHALPQVLPPLRLQARGLYTCYILISNFTPYLNNIKLRK